MVNSFSAVNKFKGSDLATSIKDVFKDNFQS